MKKLRSHSNRSSIKKAACTVSAAALMLGASEAATVGFNFQTHYCAANSYSGAIVTGQAFGIDPANWESLSQMDTGYGCSSGYYTLSETIDTTTSAGGLNPLPNGSLSLTWSGYTANVSGFGGYDRPGPHYTFGGNGYNPGNEQVYWGFIRDGVNFGPGSSGGDNNQPGYSIDITGLKSVFTNTPFVVELVSSADSMQYLTNAFIIDATANTTQSVVYPSTPPVANVGDTVWVRGIGGGLSTASGSVNTDHLQIIGNRAQHNSSFNFASTIAGFIITDKPVVTMSPHQTVVCAGDTVTWSAYAIGVPPLSYQWRKNGVAIPGATTLSYSVANVSLANIGSYDLVVTNLYGTAVSSPVAMDTITPARTSNLVLDTNPSGPEHDGLNNGAVWAASDTDGASVTRAGVMNFTAATPSQITVAGETNFDTSTGTIMFWMRSSGVADPNGKPAAIFDRLNRNGCLIVQYQDGSLLFEDFSGGTEVGAAQTVSVPSDNKWHHIAVVFDQSDSGPLNGAIIFYVDGVLDTTGITGANWAWQPGQELELGLSHDTSNWQPYNGLLDDVRYYNRALTAPEVATAYAGSTVDNAALTMRLNFDAAPGNGILLNWGATDVILQSATSVTGPYLDIPGAVAPYRISAQSAAKFYRYRGHTPVTIISNPYLM